MKITQRGRNRSEWVTWSVCTLMAGSCHLFRAPILDPFSTPFRHLVSHWSILTRQIWHVFSGLSFCCIVDRFRVHFEEACSFQSILNSVQIAFLPIQKTAWFLLPFWTPFWSTFGAPNAHYTLSKGPWRRTNRLWKQGRKCMGPVPQFTEGGVPPPPPLRRTRGEQKIKDFETRL